MPFLQLSNLHKRYDSKVAVNDLNLTINQGEFVTLLGPSGCGKTTTLRMVAGFTPPTHGTIKLDGDTITSTSAHRHLPPEKRGMGMVFQSYAVWPHMNVFNNVAYPLKLKHMPRSEVCERTLHALEMVKLAGMDKRYPNQLSGGQQQRVALARALVMEPRVLLLDEPLSNLDAKLREAMRLEIVELQKRLAITVIYVTHDQSEALVMSDRIVVMNEGEVQQVGTPDEIYNFPGNRFVADFIGVANFLEGTVDHADHEGLRLELADGTLWPLPSDPSIQRGQAVNAVVRPHHIRLAPTDSATNGHHMRGRVTQRVFLGDRINYRVIVGSVELKLQTDMDMAFAPGDPVGVKIDRVYLLPVS